MAKFPVNDFESLVNITYAASAMISGVRHCADAPAPPNISIAAVIIAENTKLICRRENENTFFEKNLKKK